MLLIVFVLLLSFYLQFTVLLPNERYIWYNSDLFIFNLVGGMIVFVSFMCAACRNPGVLQKEYEVLELLQ